MPGADDAGGRRSQVQSAADQNAKNTASYPLTYWLS